jgi:hypothetical protein
MLKNGAKVYADLSPFPPLQAVFEHCLTAFGRQRQLALALSGSMAHGTADRYSDIDFIVVPETTGFTEAQREWLTETVCSAGRPLAHFPATHLGLPNLLIFFLLHTNQVVKVDIEALTGEAFATRTDVIILHDPDGRLSDISTAAKPSERLPTPDFVDLHEKFVGWIWYTYSKTARGELLEAFDSLHIMRTQALLPSLNFAYGLPYEGYRRLEQRLSDETLAKLYKTYPRRVERRELLRALIALAELFVSIQPAVADCLGVDHRHGNITEMLAVIERAKSMAEPE